MNLDYKYNPQPEKTWSVEEQAQFRSDYNI